MTIILFFIILAILVFVHELGHFAFAKLFKIRVDEFALGFPPKIFGWKRGETQYSLNLIPIGGYVKIFGENPSEESMKGPDSARSFVNAKKWKQLVVLFAGIFMNLVFAWLLVSAAFNLGLKTGIDEGYKDQAKDVSVIITSVLKNSPADLAGLKEGDEILSVQSDGSIKKLPSISDLQNIIAKSPDKLEVLYKREDITKTAEILAKDGIVDGRKAIGISMDFVGTVQFGFFRSFYEGAKLTLLETKSIAIGLYDFIIGAFKGNNGLFDQISGPVGIAGMVGHAEHMGISYLLGFIAMISINLAVLNAIPFPALDGGRALFVLVEVAIRRKIKPAILNWANMIGFGLLLVLILFVTYKDILKLIA